MSVLLRSVFIAAISSLLAACASPYYVHDPEFGLYFRPSQIPGLLKSLRCEMATYAAANNQREIIHNALIKYLGNSMEVREEANSKYPYFALDPARYGGVALDLKIQDSLGTQSGTAFDWKRAASDGIHVHTWHIGPTLSDQSTYEALISFVSYQDVYKLSSLSNNPQSQNTARTDSFACYKSIPLRPKASIPFRYPQYHLVIPQPPKSIYTSGYPASLNIDDVRQNLEAVAADKVGRYTTFTRITVNGDKPLAEWLLDMGTRVNSTTNVPTSQEQEESMSPGQITLTFTIDTNAGLDLRYGWASGLWTAVAGDAAAGLHQTGTLTLVLNGVDALNSAGAKSGVSVRYSEIPKTAPRLRLSYTPLPEIKRVSRKIKKRLVPQLRVAPRKFVPKNTEKGGLIYQIVPLNPLGK